MILDNLSIAGLIIAALYLLLPLLFGRETWRVDEGSASRDTAHSEPPAAATALDTSPDAWDGAAAAVPCGEG